jgi:hypothetical protein
MHTTVQDCEDAAARTPQAASVASIVNWHLRLATLLVTLRYCRLLRPDLDFFDIVHAGAHEREIPTQQIFSYALDILRRHKPELENEFHELFHFRKLYLLYRDRFKVQTDTAATVHITFVSRESVLNNAEIVLSSSKRSLFPLPEPTSCP